MVQHPCASGSSRTEGCETQVMLCQQFTHYWNIDQFPPKSPISFHELVFVSGIKKLPRRGNRVEEFVPNNSMLLRITACYQGSLIDPGFGWKDGTVSFAPNTLTSKAMQVRHRFFGNHVRAKGIETEDQKTGTSLFHVQIQDAVESQVLFGD